MMKENRNELNGQKVAPEEIEESKLGKVAGGVPSLHPGHHYKDPKEEPEEPEEGGASGTW